MNYCPGCGTQYAGLPEGQRPAHALGCEVGDREKKLRAKVLEALDEARSPESQRSDLPQHFAALSESRKRALDMLDERRKAAKDLNRRGSTVDLSDHDPVLAQARQELEKAGLSRGVLHRPAARCPHGHTNDADCDPCAILAILRSPEFRAMRDGTQEEEE